MRQTGGAAVAAGIGCGRPKGDGCNNDGYDSSVYCGASNLECMKGFKARARETRRRIRVLPVSQECGAGRGTERIVGRALRLGLDVDVEVDVDVQN